MPKGTLLETESEPGEQDVQTERNKETAFTIPNATINGTVLLD